MDDSQMIDEGAFARMFEFEPSPIVHRRPRTCRPALFSVHGHAFILVAASGQLGVREVARRLRMSEDAAGEILADLVSEQVIEQVDVGGEPRFSPVATSAMASVMSGACGVAAVGKLYARPTA